MKFDLKTHLLGSLSVFCLLLAIAGCGSDSSFEEAQREVRQQAAQEARFEAEQRRRHRVAVRERHREARRLARRRVARQRAREAARARKEAEAAEAAEEADAAAESEASECDPSYSGACLDPYASDYDCEGGSGDGPEYTGPVAVVGSDHYGLDADGDGYACEY